MKALLLLTFVAVGQCALLGSKKCTYGPSYWCSHIEHARECDALQHCMTTVWKNQLQGLTGSTEGCFDVIKVLDDVRRLGAPNLLEKLAESCTKMPAGPHSVCKELMMNNQNEVQLLLQSDLPSVNVAFALGLCGSHSNPVPHPQVKNKQEANDYCTDCLNFFGDLQEIVNNSGARLEEKLKEKVCTKLGYFENLCNETVDTYISFIITVFAQQLNPQDMCFLLRFCTNETHAEFMNSIRYIAMKAGLQKMECDLCEKLTKDVQDALRDTTLQNNILSTLENKVCPMLPGDLAAQCKTYVSQYGYLVFQVLIAELDPATVCQRLGFCNATQTEKKLTVVPLGEASTVVHLQSSEPQTQAQASSPQCILCEYIMEKLESMIDSNATEEEILSALEKVCTYMPKTVEAECDDFIKQYGPEIFKLLKELGPNAICTALHLCVFDKPVLADLPVPVKGSEECLACESIVTDIRNFLNNPDNVETIEKFLDEVCVLVPPSYKGMCEDLINTYTPTLLNLLNKYDDPVTVCSELKLCNSSKMESNESGHPLTYLPMAELQPAVPHVLCSQGPEVFCASVDKARFCNAVKYCEKNYKLKVEA